MAEDNLGTKKDFGVNGKHTRLGEEFSMNEFKGYTLGTLKAIDERMERMDNYYSAVEKSSMEKLNCVKKSLKRKWMVVKSQLEILKNGSQTYKEK